MTENVQDELPFSATPAKLIAADAATAVTDPPHVFVRPGGVATWSPAGSVSLKPMLVRVWLFVFLTVKVRVVVPFRGIVGAPNNWVTVGAAVTLMFALAVPPVPAVVDVTAPVVFVRSPAATPVTLMMKVHEPLAGIVPPDRLTLPDPGVALIVPVPHVPLRAFGVETTIPLGSVSVNATPLMGTVLT